MKKNKKGSFYETPCITAFSARFIDWINFR